MQVGNIGSYKGTNDFGYISQLLYVSDTIMFINGWKWSIMNFMKLLKEYECHSGQKVNVTKCNFLLAKKASLRKKQKIQRWTSFSLVDLPTKYLGVSLFKGRSKRSYFDEIIGRIRGQICNWKNHFLSHGRKLVLIKR